MTPISGAAKVEIVLYEPSRRRDASNARAGAEKICLDALKECGIIVDDSPKWLEDVPARVEYDKANPRIEITIMEAENCGLG